MHSQFALALHILASPQGGHALQLAAWLFQGTSVPGQGLLNGVVNFITGPFGKGISLIALVLCGGGYMFGTKSDNSMIARTAIGSAIIVGAANIFAYITSAG
jgi:type IV secretory pathway VirB2 component (pilin)